MFLLNRKVAATACIPFLENVPSWVPTWLCLIDPKALALVLVWNIKLPAIQELQLLLNTTVKLFTYAMLNVNIVLFDVIIFKKSVVQTQVLAYNQRTLVKAGDIVEKGDFIADGPSMEVEKWPRSKPYRRYMTWEGLQSSRMPLP